MSSQLNQEQIEFLRLSQDFHAARANGEKVRMPIRLIELRVKYGIPQTRCSEDERREAIENMK